MQKKPTKQPFDWMVAHNPPSLKQTTIAMRQGEIRDRATVMLRLGFAPAHVKERLTANIKWEFDKIGKTKLGDEVGGIVDSLIHKAEPRPAAHARKRATKQE